MFWRVRIDSEASTATISLSCYGVRFGIQSDDPTILPSFIESLPPIFKRIQSPVVDFILSLRKTRQYYTLYHGPLRLIRTKDLNKMHEGFNQCIEYLMIRAVREKIFVHAGVVGWRGKAIVLPGRSMSGKSSMVAALLRAGATYYSDEFAIFDFQGRVHAFPRPMQIRDGRRNSAVVQVKRFGKRSLPVGLVAALKFQRDAIWQPRFLSPGETMLALLDNTVLARNFPKQSLTILKAVARQSFSIQGFRGEADTVASLLLNYLT